MKEGRQALTRKWVSEWARVSHGFWVKCQKDGLYAAGVETLPRRPHLLKRVQEPYRLKFLPVCGNRNLAQLPQQQTLSVLCLRLPEVRVPRPMLHVELRLRNLAICTVPFPSGWSKLCSQIGKRLGITQNWLVRQALGTGSSPVCPNLKLCRVFGDHSKGSPSSYQER